MELEAAKSEIEKWHSAFQSIPAVPSGTSPGSWMEYKSILITTSPSILNSLKCRSCGSGLLPQQPKVIRGVIEGAGPPLPFLILGTVKMVLPLLQFYFIVTYSAGESKEKGGSLYCNICKTRAGDCRTEGTLWKPHYATRWDMKIGLNLLNIF